MPLRPIDDLSTGLDLLNDEHDAQYCLVAAAQKAAMTKLDSRLTDGLLSLVLLSVRTHALTEGRLMQRYGFPGYSGHARRHEQLIEKARAILDTFRSGCEEVVVDQLDGLAAALNSHIGDDDAALQRHLLGLLPAPVEP